MPLAAGTRYGAYELGSLIGAGGMGEVYRARDTRLGREVALKVLPDEFARDGERIARFNREAHVLAQLNHSNIAAIYGLEELGEERCLVLELVPGDTLADRIAAGPLPLDDALALARQIADGLEAAHEKGIVHRDLKPANVKVTPEGKVKILDFGLARALGGNTPVSSSHSPTLTAAGTRAGVVLGTAAYMSPEQARGRAVDRRTDVWAFGCIVYEMLAGRQAFAGESVSDTLAAVLRSEPNWAALPPETPAAIWRLLRRCLEKDATRRLHDIGDARLELDEAGAEPTAYTPPPRRPVSGAVPWLIATVASAAALLLWVLNRPVAPPPRQVVRFAQNLQGFERVPRLGNIVFAVSRDGTHLAAVLDRGAGAQLHVRAMDQIEFRALADTQEAMSPFFSPDGRWIGFFANGKLKKVPVGGGAVVTLCDAPGPRGASWAQDDTIFFTPAFDGGIFRIPAGGGTPTSVAEPDTKHKETSYRWPQALPGGKAVLFTIGISGIRSFDDGRIAVKRLGSDPPRVLVEAGTGAQFVPSGHVIFARGGNLLAVPFDLARLETSGSPVSVLEDITSIPTSGAVPFFVSDTGTAVYLTGFRGGGPMARLVSVNRTGRAEPVPGAPRVFSTLRFSPDGRRLAVTVGLPGSQDVWTIDLERGTSIRLTSEGVNASPTWTPDGNWLLFTSLRPASPALLRVRADGSAAPEEILRAAVVPGSCLPNGRELAYTDTGRSDRGDLAILDLETRKSRPLLSTRFREFDPQFSPDGRFFAYCSDESGRNDIYVRPFPGPGAKLVISRDGGESPRWVRSGEIFYRSGNRVFAVTVKTAPELRAEPPTMLFEGRYMPEYDVAPDGKRFVLLEVDKALTEPAPLYVVVNWFEELRRRVAEK